MTAELSNCPESIPETAQCLCVETSDKYVSKPSANQITENILQALKRFKNSVYWKEFWCLKWMKESLAKGKKLNNEEGKDGLDEAEDDDKDTAINKADFEGLGTGLRLVKRMKHAPKGLNDLEHFLHRLETTLLEKVKDHTPPPKSRKGKDFNIFFCNQRLHLVGQGTVGGNTKGCPKRLCDWLA
eukprot:8636483-Ditylum_brightwellii.AAC.1